MRTFLFELMVVIVFQQATGYKTVGFCWSKCFRPEVQGCAEETALAFSDSKHST